MQVSHGSYIAVQARDHNNNCEPCKHVQKPHDRLLAAPSDSDSHLTVTPCQSTCRSRQVGVGKTKLEARCRVPDPSPAYPPPRQGPPSPDAPPLHGLKASPPVLQRLQQRQTPGGLRQYGREARCCHPPYCRCCSAAAACGRLCSSSSCSSIPQRSRSADWYGSPLQRSSVCYPAQLLNYSYYFATTIVIISTCVHVHI